MRLPLAILMGLLTMVPLMPLAAEPQGEPPKEAEPTQPEPSTSPEERPAPTSTDRPTDTFIPSEDISEDLSG
jgi:hypothetical protein